MSVFRLQYQTTTATQLVISPELDYSEPDEKIQSTHRTEAGALLLYKWGEFGIREFSVRYVNSATRSIVNSWWNTNADLLFMRSDGSEVFSCKILGDTQPITEIDVPYNDEFMGKIRLGTY